MPTTNGKLTHLECARGIASIIVIFHHFTLAFCPALRVSIVSGELLMRPLFAVMNGGAAVSFFFLLSGFVLTRGFYANPSSLRLAESVVKRLPRLMLPASITIFAGYLLLEYGAADYKIAATISGSEWLKTFGKAHFPGNFSPSLSSAISQCLYVFLLPKNFFYNSNLWTMVKEYYGSLLVFGISASFSFSKFRDLKSMLMLHAILIVVSAIWYFDFVPFILGSALAYLIEGRKVAIKLSDPMAFAVLFISIVFLSIEGARAAVAGAFLIMLALLGNETLIKRLSGPVSALVGKLSFPLYLVHTLVILSISSMFFSRMVGLGVARPIVLAGTLCLTLVAALITCLPLVFVESWWVPWLNRFTRKAVAIGADFIGVRMALAADGRQADAQDGRA